MPYIFDGHNLLQTIQKTDEEFQLLEEVGLCRILSLYLKRVRDHGHIFFDGLGPADKSGFLDLERLEVYFSGPEKEADEFIEMKIADNTAPKRLVVVSTDNRIRSAAQKRKAASVRCDLFWPDLVKHMDKQKLIFEPKEKRTGISDLETDQWMDAFGLD